MTKGIRATAAGCLESLTQGEKGQVSGRVPDRTLGDGGRRITRIANHDLPRSVSCSGCRNRWPVKGLNWRRRAREGGVSPKVTIYVTSVPPLGAIGGIEQQGQKRAQVRKKIQGRSRGRRFKVFDTGKALGPANPEDLLLIRWVAGRGKQGTRRPTAEKGGVKISLRAGDYTLAVLMNADAPALKTSWTDS